MRKTVHFFIRLMLVSIVVVLTINKHSVCQTQTFNYTGSMQYFTVPTGVTTVTIEVSGAQGGSSGTNLGGLGAKMKGDFVVTPGQQLKVLVGGQGGSSNYEAGGGGGSFVTDMSNTPLCIAGGGGGAYLSTYNYNAYLAGGTTSNTGQAGVFASYSYGSGTAGAGGVNGNGGGIYTSYGGAGSGGGGIYTNGNNGGSSTGGASFMNGGAGGTSCGNAGYGGLWRWRWCRSLRCTRKRRWRGLFRWRRRYLLWCRWRRWFLQLRD